MLYSSICVDFSHKSTNLCQILVQDVAVLCLILVQDVVATRKTTPRAMANAWKGVGFFIIDYFVEAAKVQNTITYRDMKIFYRKRMSYVSFFSIFAAFLKTEVWSIQSKKIYWEKLVATLLATMHIQYGTVRKQGNDSKQGITSRRKWKKEPWIKYWN